MNTLRLLIALAMALVVNTADDNQALIDSEESLDSKEFPNTLACWTPLGPVPCALDEPADHQEKRVACLATADHKRTQGECYFPQKWSAYQCTSECTLEKGKSSFCCCTSDMCNAPEKIKWV